MDITIGTSSSSMVSGNMVSGNTVCGNTVRGNTITGQTNTTIGDNKRSMTGGHRSNSNGGQTKK